jgi:polyphosphate kinase
VPHSHDNFEASVERFIGAAADDPLVVSIKMTVYRIGDDTPCVRSLIKAAEAGKQVACVIELKARFDEKRNLQWAAELECAGAHVIFGVRGLKAHAKTALVAMMNQIEDPEIIEALCAAACAGVAVDLVIRALCCLQPGIAGRSEGIPRVLCHRALS